MTAAQCETALADRFRAVLRADALAWDALRCARALDLPDCWVVSGCLYQAVWNAMHSRPAGFGVKDVDIVYFDAADRSYEAEDRVIRAAEPRAAGLAAPIEIRNQARVHLWYPDRFGQPYPELRNATQSLLYYASRTHAVAARLGADDEIALIAPFGLADIFAPRMTPNPALDTSETYTRKAARVAELWPRVDILPWRTG